MRALDIVERLSRLIPLYTDAFSSSVSITSIVPTGATATVTTSAPHGAVDGQNVAITGADAPVQILSLLRTGSVAVIDTVQDHDLTFSERDRVGGGKTITISGANEAEFNGTFPILSVANRREVTIAVEDSGATSISGVPLIENANGNLFNGLYPIFNVTATTFDYTLKKEYTLPASGTPLAQTSIRIAACLDVRQYLNDIYTKQVVGDHWLIVQLGDVTRSKNKTEVSDASDTSAGEYAYTPTFIQPFGVYIVQNLTRDLDGATARDNVESIYVPAVFKCLERAKLDTGFTYSQFRATCTEHGVFAFDTPDSKGKALYVHEMVFEQIAILDKVADTTPPDDDVAMRDVGYEISSDKGAGLMTANVDLDDEPLT